MNSWMKILSISWAVLMVACLILMACEGLFGFGGAVAGVVGFVCQAVAVGYVVGWVRSACRKPAAVRSRPPPIPVRRHAIPCVAGARSSDGRSTSFDNEPDEIGRIMQEACESADAAGASAIESKPEKREEQKQFIPIKGHEKHESSITADSVLTFGWGELLDNGHWAHGCFNCAREWEKQFPEDGPCWPFSPEYLDNHKR